MMTMYALVVLLITGSMASSVVMKEVFDQEDDQNDAVKLSGLFGWPQPRHIKNVWLNDGDEYDELKGTVRDTEKEMSMLRETVARQGENIKNLERDMASLANLATTLQASNPDVAVPVQPTQMLKRASEVAFTAYLDHDIDPRNGHLTIKFNKEGMYLFSFHMAERSEQNHVRQLFTELRVNSHPLVGAAAQTNHQYDDAQGGNTVVVSLKKGDAVWVDAFQEVDHHIEGDEKYRLSTFTGVYLY